MKGAKKRDGKFLKPPYEASAYFDDVYVEIEDVYKRRSRIPVSQMNAALLNEGMRLHGREAKSIKKTLDKAMRLVFSGDESDIEKVEKLGTKSDIVSRLLKAIEEQRRREEKIREERRRRDATERYRDELELIVRAMRERIDTAHGNENEIRDAKAVLKGRIEEATARFEIEFNEAERGEKLSQSQAKIESEEKKIEDEKKAKEQREAFIEAVDGVIKSNPPLTAALGISLMKPFMKELESVPRQSVGRTFSDGRGKK